MQLESLGLPTSTISLFQPLLAHLPNGIGFTILVYLLFLSPLIPSGMIVLVGAILYCRRDQKKILCFKRNKSQQIFGIVLLCVGGFIAIAWISILLWCWL
jgi:hypothetical protein